MPTTCSPRSSRALATWKPVNPERVGRGSFSYLFAAPQTRAFVNQEPASGVGRDVPAGTPGAAAGRSATASARAEVQGFLLAGGAPPSNHRRRPPNGRHAGSPRHG